MAKTKTKKESSTTAKIKELTGIKPEKITEQQLKKVQDTVNNLKITTAINGLVYKGEIVCIQVPSGGDDDINLASNSASLAAQADVDDSNGQLLTNAGVHTLAKTTAMTIPAGGIQDDYIYLAAGAGDTAGNYTHGVFLIKFYGAKLTSI
jgi:hypothetical protein